ncbi:MAG: hypothetical protein NT013_24195 [Planctomycetia bacterium]|nr:hypothetical protein [Planctomycetia bacterium]
MVWILRISMAWVLLLAPVEAFSFQPKGEKGPNELLLNKPIDLLSMVKLPENVMRGNWKRIDGALSCEAGPDAMFFVPVAVHGNYQLNCEFTRRTHDDHVSITFPVGLTSETLILSAWNGAASGLHMVDRKEAKDLPLATGAVVRPSKLVNGQRYELVLDVTQTNDRITITAALNGKRFVAWKGLASQLSCWTAFAPPCPQAVAVIVHQSVADIHKLELTLKKGSGFRLDGNAAAPLGLVAKAPPKQIADKCLNWNGHKYFVTDKPLNYSDARRLAAQLQGRLLTISSADEEAFILKEGRGLAMWMSGWRHHDGNDWRDEFNRPLRHIGRWERFNPNLRYAETQLAIGTSPSSSWFGWNDCFATDTLHVCIEWGEE